MKYRTAKEEKFDSIYRSYSNDIYKVCLYLVKDRELAQDIMQQTFFDLYKNLENVSEDCMFAYLVYTAKNMACNNK